MSEELDRNTQIIMKAMINSARKMETIEHPYAFGVTEGGTAANSQPSFQDKIIS